MITYLTNRPILSIVFILIGVSLIIAAIAINPLKPIKAGAAHTIECKLVDERYNYPFVKATNEKNYASNWLVTQWLIFDKDNTNNSGDKGFPIGPAAWQVCGSNRNGSTVTTYQEKWLLEEVRLASSRMPREFRGQAVVRNGDHGFRGNNLRVGDVDIDSNTQDDKAFKSDPNQAFNPVGLYGVLSDSAEELGSSRSYFPSKWSVSGTYE